LNSEKIWKMRKKSELNSEKIWKFWKKKKTQFIMGKPTQRHSDYWTVNSICLISRTKYWARLFVCCLLVIRFYYLKFKIYWLMQDGNNLKYCNRSAAIMSRDIDFIPSCLIVVLFEFLIHFIWENEGSVSQANIYVWKTHSMLSSTITLFIACKFKI
jgi:hypothetical protein